MRIRCYICGTMFHPRKRSTSMLPFEEPDDICNECIRAIEEANEEEERYLEEERYAIQHETEEEK